MGVRSNIYSSIFSIFPWDLTLPFGRAPRPQNAQGHEDRQGPITIAHLESRAQRLTVEGWTCESLTHFNYLVVEPTNHLKNIISSNWIISPNGDEHRKHTFGTNFDQGSPQKKRRKFQNVQPSFVDILPLQGMESCQHDTFGQMAHSQKKHIENLASFCTVQNLEWLNRGRVPHSKTSQCFCVVLFKKNPQNTVTIMYEWNIHIYIYIINSNNYTARFDI